MFLKWTPLGSTTYQQFVGRLDGNCGFAVVETDNAAHLADALSKFSFIAEYQIYPVVDMAESVQAIQEGVKFRQSIT